MSIVKILHEGEPVLRQVSTPWDLEDPSLLPHLRDLRDTFRNGPPAVGLASPQVGVARRSVLISVLKRTYGGPDKLDVSEPLDGILVNPEIVWKSDDLVRFDEGCLSLPGVHAVIHRPADVRVKATFVGFNAVGRMDGSEEREVLFTGMVSRVIQHELDHLDGKLFIDHLEGVAAVNARIDWKNAKKRLEKKARKVK